MMNRYAFTLGHQPHVSFAEIHRVFAMHNWEYTLINQTPTHAIIDTSQEIDGLSLARQLGGTLRIAKQVFAYSSTVVDVMADYLDTTQSVGKIVFSLSGNKRTTAQALAVKKTLKKRGRSVRYVEIKNTASIVHNKLVDLESHLSVIGDDVFVTIGVQAMASFADRDTNKPGIDAKSGMLPPKLARTMINLSGIVPTKNTVLLDAYCGSGVVLLEAIDLGFTHVIGSDLSEKAVADTKQNLDWFTSTKNLHDVNYTVHEQDVRTINTILEKESVDVLISEPYMGKPLHGNESLHFLENQALELKNLFVEGFQAIHQVMKPNGVVVFIIPQFKHASGWVTIDCLNAICDIGFAIEPMQGKDVLVYHRPDQHVGRGVVVLQKV